MAHETFDDDSVEQGDFKACLRQGTHCQETDPTYCGVCGVICLGW